MKRIESHKGFIAAMFVLLLAAGVVMAIAPGTLFELDGDSLTGNQTPNPPTDDWNLLNGAGVATGCVQDTAGAAGSSVTRSFCSGAGPNIFTQGGSKDPNLISDWKWKPSDQVPDKDTLTNGYAARYQDSGSGHTIFVFGAERFATNGDANIGIWLFKNEITNLPGGTFGPGAHANGDLFAVSAFTTGGTNPVITVYKWSDLCTKGIKSPTAEIPTGGTPGGTPNSCAESNLSLAFVSAAGTSCTSGDAACAATNSTGPITVSWPYAAKFGGAVNEVPTAGFFEGGIDTTELLAGSDLCFSSFLIETRSSQEPNAVLKDFIAGKLGGCTMPIVKLINGVEPTDCHRIDPTNPALGANLSGICHDALGNVVTGLFTATIFGPPPIPVSGLSVAIPPRFEAIPLIGVPLIVCETIPVGWKLIETNDVTLVLTPPSGGFNTTPTVYPHATLPRTRCFDFTIPTGTITFEIRINNVQLKLKIEKSASVTINYGYIITNNGSGNITGTFTVSDGALIVSCTQPGDGALSPGESMTCTAVGPTFSGTQGALVPFGPVTNTATASGGGITSPSDSVTVTGTIDEQ